MLFHLIKIVFFFTNSFQRERIFLVSKLFFPPKYHKTILFPPINESIMIFKNKENRSSFINFRKSLLQNREVIRDKECHYIMIKGSVS